MLAELAQVLVDFRLKTLLTLTNNREDWMVLRVVVLRNESKIGAKILVDACPFGGFGKLACKVNGVRNHMLAVLERDSERC